MVEITRPNNEMDIAQESHDPPKETKKLSSLEGKVLERRRRRFLDVRTLAGVARAHATLFREMMTGRLSLAHFEIASRGLKRHSEILSTLEQQEQLADIQAKLTELQASRNQPALPAPVERELPDWAKDE